MSALKALRHPKPPPKALRCFGSMAAERELTLRARDPSRTYVHSG
jgi:hypothetical protein